MKMKTIRDAEELVQGKISEVLKQLGLLPRGYEPSVRFYGETKRKKQTATLEKNWHPESDSIKIEFKPAEASAQLASPLHAAQTSQAQDTGAELSDELSEMVRALAHAEARPGYKFVALKWFRDTALPAEGFEWAESDVDRKAILADAIDRKWILTSSVPNPNSPYPTTTVRVNRLMPQVQGILGIQATGITDFAPVPMRGESLSATILSDRR